jgi:hypothetical protein
MRVAMRRAAHQAFDVPKVLNDPLALLIAGEPAQTIQAAADKHQSRFGKNMRAFLVARGLAAGVEQYQIWERGSILRRTGKR